MKKTLVSALTTALVVGAASTTFAAANPFADVPADHWAYDAVAQLVQDGVVNGYSVDGTFKGDQSMSRYEMAQIVAKAMAKADAADNNNKALIDKLAAEFSDELSNLGVRVADLEAKSDNVQWKGLIRYDWTHNNYESNGDHENSTNNYIKLRFEPSMTINENWTGHARIEYVVDKDETTGGNNGDVDLKRIYTEGKYGKFSTKLGRFGSFSDNSHGLVMDTEVTGIELNYKPSSAWKIKATAGRIDNIEELWETAELRDANGESTKRGSGTYWDVEVDYTMGKWDAGAAYRYIGATKTLQESPNDTNNSFHVVDLGVGYAFDKNVKVIGDFAWGSSVNGNKDYGYKNLGNTNGWKKNAYNIEVDYKGANAEQKGSWGAYVAYRQLSPFASFATTYDLTGLCNSVKGWEIGANYTFTKNIIGSAKYFNGKETSYDNSSKGDKYTGVFTRVDFIF